jgi:tRNA-guanine family transglycosylase
MNEFLFDFPERPKRRLETASGVIDYPAYIPVTTYGDTYPLDALIQPYLPRLAQAIMVSFHYAQAMNKKPRIPILIDSGGFAALFQGSEITEEHGLGILRLPDGDKIDELTPMRVLDFQEQHADVGFTLDFPIPPDTDRYEADRRMRLTCANAVWALENRRRKEMRLFACIQGLEADDYLKVAGELAGQAFDGFAIGGLVPRARDRDLIESVVVGVLERIGDRPLHVFGMGKPETTQRLFDLGVDSVDSSSYVKLAADGKSWIDTESHDDPATTDRLLLALSNLAEASRSTPFGRRRGMVLREGLA